MIRNQVSGMFAMAVYLWFFGGHLGEVLAEKKMKKAHDKWRGWVS